MTEFVHQRHKPPVSLETARELIVACVPLRSNINLSHIVRTAGCSGVGRVICCGNAKIDSKIARDGADSVVLEVRRTLAHRLLELKQAGYRLVGLEQTTGSVSLPQFAFERKTVLVVGNERLGIEPDILRLLDAVVEIPVFGQPHSFNVATATAMALYEFCCQFPHG